MLSRLKILQYKQAMENSKVVFEISEFVLKNNFLAD